MASYKLATWFVQEIVIGFGFFTRFLMAPIGTTVSVSQFIMAAAGGLTAKNSGLCVNYIRLR